MSSAKPRKPPAKSVVKSPGKSSAKTAAPTKAVAKKSSPTTAAAQTPSATEKKSMTVKKATPVSKTTPVAAKAATKTTKAVADKKSAKIKAKSVELDDELNADDDLLDDEELIGGEDIPEIEVIPAKNDKTKGRKSKEQIAEQNAVTLEFKRTQMKNLIKLGKDKGYLTHAEINDNLPDDMVEGDALDAMISAFVDMGIQVYEQAPDAETLLMADNVPTATNDDDTEEEAEAILAKAQSDTTDLITRRQKMAEDRISAAERTALAEVRAKAAKAATDAAASLIADKHDKATDKGLVDKAIETIGNA